VTSAAPGALSVPDSIPQRVKFPILIGACLLLLLQALTMFSTRWVEDESWYAVTAHTLLTRGELRIPIFHEDAPNAKVDMRPPLTMIIMAGFFKVLGTNIYSARLPFLLSGLACIFLTYLLGCELGRPWVGLLGAVALATDNLMFVASWTARPESMAAAFALLGVLVYLQSRRKNSVKLALLSGLLVGLGTLVHTNAFAAAISAGVFALIEFRWTLVWKPRPWAFAAGLLLPLAIFVAWGMSDAVHRSEFISLYQGGEGHTLSEIPHLEWVRYRDFLGMGSTRVNLPVNVPTRLHIVLALFLSALALYRYDRELLKDILCLILPAMVWWAYERNITPRYIATGSPYLALLLAGAVVSLWKFKPKWHMAVAACATLLLLSQVAGNALLLYLYRQADYAVVTRQLRAIIPADAHVYGALTFWMALYDMPYYSWNRTPVKYAVDRGVNYLILNDRVLVHGSGQGTDDWVERRTEAADFVRDHATLIGHAPNPFYGDLEIYSAVRYRSGRLFASTMGAGTGRHRFSLSFKPGSHGCE
jgi:4-amino-4-deoxy-L-arabinose transferase-like glycosyltransferase